MAARFHPLYTLHMRIEDRLAELGLTLPPPAKPAGNYLPWVRSGNLLFLAGQLPLLDGKVMLTGKVGDGENTVEQGAEAARQCALNALALVQDAVGFENLVRVVRLGAFVNSAPAFTAQPRVANGASDLLVEILGEAGKHVRTAVGANELPLDAAVEIDFVFEVR